MYSSVSYSHSLSSLSIHCSPLDFVPPPPTHVSFADPRIRYNYRPLAESLTSRPISFQTTTYSCKSNPSIRPTSGIPPSTQSGLRCTDPRKIKNDGIYATSAQRPVQDHPAAEPLLRPRQRPKAPTRMPSQRILQSLHHHRQFPCHENQSHQADRRAIGLETPCKDVQQNRTACSYQTIGRGH